MEDAAEAPGANRETAIAPGAAGAAEPRDDRTSAAKPPTFSPRWAVIGIFLMLAVAGLAYARVFLTPVILGFILALVFSPVRRALGRMGVGSAVSAFLIVASLVVSLLTIGTLLASPVRGWIADAPTIGAKLENRVVDIRRSLGGTGEGASVGEVVEQVEEAAAPKDKDVQEVVVRERGYLAMLASTAPAILLQIVLTLVLLGFLLASGEMFYEKLVHALPTYSDKRRAIGIAREVERKLSRYFLTITVINAGLGLSIGLTMWALGMPDPLLFGTIGFLFNYVPYVGAVVGSSIALVVGLLTFDGVLEAFLPGLAYYALTSIEGQFITPYFVGRNLKLNTVVVFVSITFWAWLWSVVGMLVAVPLLVITRTVCERIPGLRALSDFLSARGAEDDAQEPLPGDRASKETA
jgi:predicted PurR-regulated permease PerM